MKELSSDEENISVVSIIYLKFNHHLNLKKFTKTMMDIVNFLSLSISSYSSNRLICDFEVNSFKYSLIYYNDITTKLKIIKDLYNEFFNVETSDDENETVKKSYITKQNFVWNGPLKLSSSSRKKLKDAIIGDILYGSDKGLTLSKIKTAEPIAIYIGKNNDDYVFASINYMSYATPETGSLMKNERCFLYFNGPYEYININSYQDALDAVNNIENFSEYRWNKPGPILNNPIEYYRTHLLNAPLINAVYKFHTKGTVKGDWCLLKSDEFENLYNFNCTKIIANVRKTKFRQGRFEGLHWTITPDVNDKIVIYKFTDDNFWQDLFKMTEDRYYNKYLSFAYLKLRE